MWQTQSDEKTWALKKKTKTMTMTMKVIVDAKNQQITARNCMIVENITRAPLYCWLWNASLMPCKSFFSSHCVPTSSRYKFYFQNVIPRREIQTTRQWIITILPGQYWKHLTPYRAKVTKIEQFSKVFFLIHVLAMICILYNVHILSVLRKSMNAAMIGN